MELNLINLRKSINKAYLKVKPNRTQIETFKRNIGKVFNEVNEKESEEFHKNIISGFLKDTYYEPDHYINTKGRTDLVIHKGKDTKSPVSVLIETKNPSNKTEWPTKESINSNAFQELVLYYLRELITVNNLEITCLIATNIYEWFIFDSSVFEKVFAGNKKLVKQFNDFEEGRLSGKTTDFFYKNIAGPFIDQLDCEISFTYFNIQDFEKIIKNQDKQDDNKLVALYKIFSPEHLLKLPFTNDSNSLDKSFYSELLHIIGLKETKNGNKKLISRKPESERNPGSLIENAITILQYEDCLSQIKTSDFGDTKDEQLYNIALELVITWINRVLFLKLLEGQLVKYHSGDKSFKFLNNECIPDYDALNKLFFQVLAVKENERNEQVKNKFVNIPYLNSSLFEPTDLEHKTIRISNLEGEYKLPVINSTVLKDKTGKRLQGEINTLQYLYLFLDAYDFASEGSEEIQEENKTLINASVLGLIFEKINGYKDGSFFTPGFITMYMCRETIRKAVVQKFNDAKGWNCKTIKDVYNKIEDLPAGLAGKKEANNLINSLKICDPAVGSGHFLVSALNEIIAIKNDLKILLDHEGKTLRDYNMEIANDELVITGEEGEIFEYKPKNKERQRIQKALFHEKQTIIENCLFGVDINPNSVKICRLRLWIELLKNAYYKDGSEELETLPNIDINIKCGNSLVSRYPLNADIKKALQKSKWSIESYRLAVMTYRNAQTKEEKRAMEKLIEEIKNGFENEIAANDKRILQLNRLKGELFELTNQNKLFEQTKVEKEKWDKQVNEKTTKIRNLETGLEETRSNKIYENAFEWRFEFPEVLNEEGDFVGFDVVIGNPPYIRQEEIKDQKNYLKYIYKTYTGTADLYVFFVEKGFEILKRSGHFCYVMPNKWMQAEYGKPLRSLLLENKLQSIIDFGDLQVFDEATTYPCILNISKDKPEKYFHSTVIKSLKFDNGFEQHIKSDRIEMNTYDLSNETWLISSHADQCLLSKIKANSIRLSDYVGDKAFRGILTGLSEAFIINNEIKKKLVNEDPKSIQFLKPFLLGRNIKPYSCTNAQNWLILIPKGYTIKKNLPSNNPNYISEPPPRYGNMPYDDAWQWFSSNYPAIAKYLLPYKSKAEKRTDKGDYWWELRACEYYQEFEKPKIMYQVFQVKPCFIYDDSGMFCNNSIWFIPTKDKILLGILNSKIGWWLFSKYCTAIQNGHQLIWKYFGQITIAKSNEKLSKQIINMVDEIIDRKKQNHNAGTSELEEKIDQLVYELYGLTEEDIKIVEGSIS